jgi:hypothetical protein
MWRCPVKSLLVYVITFVVVASVAALGIGFFFTPAVGAAPTKMPAVANVESGADAGFSGWLFELDGDGSRWHSRLSIGKPAPVEGRVRSVEVFSKCFTAANICTVTYAEITDAAGHMFTAYPVGK